MSQEEWLCQLRNRGRHLIAYREICADPAYAALLNLLDLLSEPNSDPEELFTAARNFFIHLAEAGEIPPGDSTGDPWPDYLLDQIIKADNVFTRQAAKGKRVEADHVTSSSLSAGRAGISLGSPLGKALLQAVRQDLRLLQEMAEAGRPVYQTARRRLAAAGMKEELPDWPELTDGGFASRQDPRTVTEGRPPSFGAMGERSGSPSRPAVAEDRRDLSPSWPIRFLGTIAEARLELKKALAGHSWDSVGLDLLMNYYASYGAGLFGQFWAFRWVRGEKGGELEGIANPDPVQWADLVGYEKERAEVRQNTEKFLHGLPASNVLLYGARGTGKSSTVKGLLNIFGWRGLRLIELPKRHLSDYQEILKRVASEPLKFIIFIDDLSFEEEEVEYKELKGLLEGSLQVRPGNVLVYATSNRRHLVKEYFSDRDQAPVAGDEEVRQADTLQEKLSLAERFGLTIIFFSPDQEEYLTIVRELAARRGLDIEEGELRRQALRWVLFQNGTSGRTARQFVDHLYGELSLKKAQSDLDMSRLPVQR